MSFALFKVIEFNLHTDFKNKNLQGEIAQIYN